MDPNTPSPQTRSIVWTFARYAAVGVACFLAGTYWAETPDTLGAKGGRPATVELQTTADAPPMAQVARENNPRLVDLVMGIPGGRTEFSEVRTAFTPDEVPMVRGVWTLATAPLPVTFRWHDPSGKEMWNSELEVNAEWRNTWVRYRGKAPMAEPSPQPR